MSRRCLEGTEGGEISIVGVEDVMTQSGSSAQQDMFSIVGKLNVRPFTRIVEDILIVFEHGLAAAVVSRFDNRFGIEGRFDLFHVKCRKGRFIEVADVV